MVDHAKLTNLNYGSSGHTGFAQSIDLITVSGALQSQIDYIEENLSHSHDDLYYTKNEVDTISGSLQSQGGGIESYGHFEYQHTTTSLYYIENSHTDWRAITINTEVSNSGQFSLSSNQITLPAGIYKVDVMVPLTHVAAAPMVELYDTTNTTTLLAASISHNYGDDLGLAHISGFFTLSGEADLELQLRTISDDYVGIGYLVTSAQKSRAGYFHHTSISLMKIA